jgi:hypothetical protein
MMAEDAGKGNRGQIQKNYEMTRIISTKLLTSMLPRVYFDMLAIEYFHGTMYAGSRTVRWEQVCKQVVQLRWRFHI